jgi:hypothetical protein
LRVLFIAWRQVDDDVALVGQNLAGEGAMQAKTGVQSGFTGCEQGSGCVLARLRVRRVAFWIQSLRTSIVYRVLAWGSAEKNGCPACYINKKSAVLQDGGRWSVHSEPWRRTLEKA